MRFRSGIILLVLLGWWATTARLVHAGTFYVDPKGVDNNSGTEQEPWLTIQRAAEAAQPGDTVLVNNGVYAGFHTARGGTKKAAITFKANGNQVVINSRNSATPDAINVESADYVVIDGFVVKDAPRAGIRVVESAGVTVRNNKVGPNQMWAIFTGFTPGIQILDNQAFGSKEQHGIYVSNSRGKVDYPVIRGNDTYQNNQNGIQLNGDCHSGGDGIIDGALIENNSVHDNGNKGLSLISMQDSVVQNNLIFDNGLRGGAGGIHLTDEFECHKPSSNNTVVNNTIIELRIAGIRITDGAVKNRIFNNLVVSGKPIVDEVGGNSIDRDSNIERHSVKGLFVDPKAGDFHLANDSLARDAGVAAYEGQKAPRTDVEGNRRPAGRAVDVGAYERK